MGRLRFIWALALVVALTVSLGATAQAKSVKTIFRADLVGAGVYSAANGKAVYKVSGSERELQIEVEDARALAGKTVNVYINGVKVGSMSINSLGDGRFSRNSSLGQSVPALGAGTSVMIKTTAGVLVVSGIAKRVS